MSGFTPIFENKHFDPDFWHKYSICTYPNTGQGKSELPDFSNQLRTFDEILSKSNIASNSSCRTHIPDQIWIGAGCDPYCRQEKRERLTRRILEVIAKHKCSVFIATRNVLVLRDIDLIQEINEISHATVAITSSSLHIKTLRYVEPRATSLNNRKLIVKRLQRAGIGTGLMVTPFIQGANDSTAELEKTFKWSAENHLDFVLFPSLFADSRGRVTSSSNLIRKGPKRYPTGRLSPHESICDSSTDSIIFQLSRRFNVSLRIARFCPSDFRKENYRFAADLADLAFYRRLCRLPFRVLLKAARCVDSLNTDIRNLIRQNSLLNQPWMEKSILPEVNALLEGKNTTDIINSYSVSPGSGGNHE